MEVETCRMFPGVLFTDTEMETSASFTVGDLTVNTSLAHCLIRLNYKASFSQYNQFSKLIFKFCAPFRPEKFFQEAFWELYLHYNSFFYFSFDLTEFRQL